MSTESDNAGGRECVWAADRACPRVPTRGWRSWLHRGVLIAGLSTGFGGAAPALSAQQSQAERELSLRVSSVTPGGGAWIDRGARDGVNEGDRVLLLPRDAAPLEGHVMAVEAGRARVELLDRHAFAEPGMRGVVYLPASRARPDAPVAPPELPDHPPWENQDEDYVDGQPLLASVDALRPEQRPQRTSGRLYALLDVTRTGEDDRSSSFVRVGGDVLVDNPFGHGGALHADVELNQREVDVPDPGDEDESRTKGRLDRLSYTWGGTRWDPVRRQVGRFVQHAMPEFGVLDGAEWSLRLDDGDLVSASAGFLPSSDRDQTSFDDLQLATSYTWTLDENGRAAASAGYQKTWHEGTPDRDLIVAKARLVPEQGWAWHGVAWIDRYTGSDDNEGAGFEASRVRASASRRDDDGDTVRVSYLHQERPELLADEFNPLTAAAVADSHSDRLSWEGSQEPRRGLRLRAELGAWSDEEQSGGDAEVGAVLTDVIAADSRVEATLFASRGRFTKGAGGRLGYGWGDADGSGRWQVSYELFEQEFDDFDGDFGQLLQHWLRISRQMPVGEQWDLSMHLDARVWEQEHAWSAGAYLQRRF